MVSHIEGCQIADALKQRWYQMSGREGGEENVVSESCSSSESFLRHVGEAQKGSTKSDRTLKNSDSLKWYDELRNCDPINFLM